MKRFIIAVMMVLSSAAIIQARIINIPADYATIQLGINAVTSGDTVLVQPGTYVENLVLNEHGMTLGSYFLTTGDTSFIASTIIDGDSSSTVITVPAGNEDIDITGFTVQRGRGAGGGTHVRGRNVFIRNNIIRENVAAGFPAQGGGIFCEDNSFCVISNCVVMNNRAGDGGGIYCSNSGLYARNNIIKNNQARFSGEDGWGGGGIYLYGITFGYIQGNIIIDNLGDMGGGGIKCVSSSSTSIENNVIYNNSIGGGIVTNYSNISIANNIIWNNLPDQIHFYSSNDTVAYNNIMGGYDGNGNINLDPVFRDPTNGDFHLMSASCGDPDNSPCIDAGNPAILDLFLDCQWGLGTSRSDMGAYGGRDSIATDIEDQLVQLPLRTGLFQNYPNPFNPSTTIKYSISQSSNVQINIFNLLGQKVETLFDGCRNAGEYSVLWNASEVPSGVYFAKLNSEMNSKSLKMMLLK